MSIICDTITWVDADGNELVLSSQADRAVLQGARGRGLPPIVLSEEVVPLQPGARVRYVNHGPRDYAVPFVLWADTYAELGALLRSYLPRFDPLRGTGVLRIDTPDGVTRELTCRYLAGMERDQAPPNEGMSESEHRAHQVLQPVFHADDPYWYDATAYTATFTSGGAEGAFFPIPNPNTGSFITLVGSSVFTTVTIDLDTDLMAGSWPIWTITGPGSGIALRNVTTGDVIDFSNAGGLTLAAGEVATLDLRPGIKTLELADGTNLYPYLTNASVLWPLGPTQQVQIEITDADADTEVGLWVRGAFLTV